MKCYFFKSIVQEWRRIFPKFGKRRQPTGNPSSRCEGLSFFILYFILWERSACSGKRDICDPQLTEVEVNSSLFQALGQWGRIGKKRGTKIGVWSRSSLVPRFFLIRPHWPRAWNRLLNSGGHIYYYSLFTTIHQKKRRWISMSVHSLRNFVHNTFATKYLFQNCFARKFENRLVQNAMDSFAVHIVLWVTLISPTGIFSIDCGLPMTLNVYQTVAFLYEP